MWARNDNGRCAEFITSNPEGAYHPDIQWVEVPAPLRAWVDPAYIVTEAGAVAPPSLDHIKDQAKGRAAERRYRAETGGIVVGGAPIRTDRESQALINGAKALAEAEPAEPVEFKGGGGWVTLDSPTMIAIGLAVGRHVRDCFRRERAICELIDAAETAAEVIAIFNSQINQDWPPTAPI